MLAKCRRESSISLEYLTGMGRQLADQIGSCRKSLDKIWKGLAIRDLFVYAEGGGFMEKYLASSFKEILGFSSELILRNYLADNKTNFDQNGKSIAETFSLPQKQSIANLSVHRKLWENPRAKCAGNAWTGEKKISINLFTLYYFVKVTEIPSTENYGDLIPINDIIVSVFANTFSLKLIQPGIEEFVNLMAGEDSA